MRRRYIGGRVSAGSLGSSLPSPGPRVTAVFVPRLLWATDEKENVGWTVYCGPRRGLGAHNRPPLCEGFSLNDLSDAFNSSPRDSKECWGEVAAWTVGKKTTRILILGNTQPPPLREHTPGQSAIDSVTPWDILPLLKYSPWNFPSKYPNPWEKTLHAILPCAWEWGGGYLTYSIRCLMTLFIKIPCSTQKLLDVIVFQKLYNYSSQIFYSMNLF